MKRIGIAAGLMVVALCTGGCATHALLHAVGRRQEIPANISQSAVKEDCLVVNYIGVLADGERHVLRNIEPIQRQAIFDLGEPTTKGQWKIGHTQPGTNLLTLSSSDYRTVLCTTEGGQPESVLGTNAVVILGSQAESFRVIRNAGSQTSHMEVIYCRVETTRWEKWWRRPAQVFGFPFACAIDAVTLPFNAAIWGCFLLQERNQVDRTAHPESKKN